MKAQFKDLFFVVALISIIILFQQDEEKPAEPITTATPTVVSSPVRTLSVGEVVPSFSLLDSEGEIVLHEQGQGPLFITLTARGCKGCMERVDSADVAAYEMAKKSEVTVWNMLVYHPDAGTAEFVRQFQPSADSIMADPKSDISVKMLGGSDSTCWLLLDDEGKLAYRGPVDLERLQDALGRLKS